ncbi:MAG: flippase-like domain-containing protein [Deltaproteobacteria bacterium]|nr:flippase-like domain-containing protein [Deltaproteobacteria bacterium]
MSDRSAWPTCWPSCSWSSTRLLDLLMSAGVIAYTDMDYGFIRGIPNLGDYLKSQDAVDGRLVIICFCIYFGFYLVKAAQFHTIARAYGLKGSFGRHARAFLYGVGLNRLLPYNAGDIGVVSALEGQGEPRERAASVIYAQDMFVWFEIAFFLFLGLVLTGWGMTFAQTLPALIFFGALYFITRKARSNQGPEARDNGGAYKRILHGLANDPWLLVKLGVLSLFAFFLDDITPFVTSQAFTSQYVHLNVPFLIIQAGVVSGYIASRVPITPGCIGQFEFGFGTALVMGGVALPEAITIAILDGMIRHGSGLILFMVVKIWHGVETDLRTVLDTFAGRTGGAPAKAQ